ncbi:MAG: hypothetical protein ACT4TC_00500 [Myxococcaceae bacterium]
MSNVKYPGPFVGGSIANFLNGNFNHHYEVDVKDPNLTDAQAAELIKNSGFQGLRCVKAP